MQNMYETYGDIAEFRIVYIKEAHASDSSWPVPYAKEKGIKEHTTFGERCDVAKKLLDDNKLTIPTVVDNMENEANEAYKAWPDKVFVVRTDGRLAVAAKRGPWGFKPAMDEAKKWLAEFKETGNEPPLPEDAAPAEGGEDDRADAGDAKQNDVVARKTPAPANAKIACITPLSKVTPPGRGSDRGVSGNRQRFQSVRDNRTANQPLSHSLGRSATG